jgi:hypothetical protein
MNDMTRIPRHRQKPIAIRSDKAARLLAELTRDGRSQAKVIEDALEIAARDRPKPSPEEFVAQVKAIVMPAHGLVKKSYHEIRAEMYDEFGLPI